MNSVAGVFSTQEKATQHVKRLISGKSGDPWDIDVDVDDSICWSQRNDQTQTTEILSVMKWEVDC
uniref:Uncharacterized protein n=1 Tax=Marseillevirus LCMAC101 TaxID=2506602 RepID=A0A481YRU2_9VIRU|nr:MAG: hypothetical protein LCMAC101_02420 [Marseillevirus LCMAC101]